MVITVGIGVLAGLAIQLALAPGGRHVGELGIAPPAPEDRGGEGGPGGRGGSGAPAGGGTNLSRHGKHPPVGCELPRGLGRGGPRGGGRAGDLPVRVLVLQVVALLRSGSDPVAAWSGPTGVPVDPTGVPDPVGLERLLGARAARAAIAATRLALDVGAPLSQVLEAVADSLVRDAEARAERDAAIAGPRMTARVILWLPVVGAALGWLLGADIVAVATDGGAGTAVILLGLALLAAGWTWSSRLVARAMDPAPGADLDVQVLLELLAAALGAGVGVPRALEAVGQAAGGRTGGTLLRAGEALVLGAGWERAWEGATTRLRPVVAALRTAWSDGVAPGEALRAAGQEDRRERGAAARATAARLGVQLVLPLGACYLPAFVLVGLVPVLVALGIDVLGG